MWKYIPRLCGTLCLLALTACASSGSSSSGAAAPNRNVLTQEDIQAVHRQNAYEVVETLRSNWLRTRGRTTLGIGRDAEVMVYVNDSKMGGVDQLRAIPTNTISYIQWYDGNAAAGRWGLDHGAGVIYVSTRPPSR